MKFIDLNITSPNSTLINGNKYRVNIDGQFVSFSITSADLPPGFNIPGWLIVDRIRRPEDFTYNGQIKVEKVNPHSLLVNSFWQQPPFKDILEQLPIYNTRFGRKTYTITVSPQGSETVLCSMPLTVGNDCTIEYINKNWDGSENIQFYINDNSYNNMSPGEHRVLLKRGTDTVFNHCYSLSTLTDKNKGVDLSNDLKKLDNIGNLDVYSNYILEVRDSCNGNSAGSGEEKACERSFPICPAGTAGEACQPAATSSGGFAWGPVQPAAERKDVCKPTTVNGKVNFTCNTAIGDFETEPTLFIKKIFGFLLGVSGGIALILIIISGYNLMMAQGNPEKIQGAKETLTSAIVGLLFIIFSFVILEVVGVDLLKIPGLSK
ncbi:hypothetical protein C4559_01380 [Candidatus Microgenomates bacterium]|nr:MAG: hypothetical protein C4559_01380 [Candidatus Microgenomates bacterium]